MRKAKLAVLGHSEGQNGYHRLFLRSNFVPSIRQAIRSAEIALGKKFKDVQVVEMACAREENGWLGGYVVFRDKDEEDGDESSGGS